MANQAFVCCLVLVVACLVFAGPAPSAGVIYKYEDERGITHYTDRRDPISDKVRNKAEDGGPGQVAAAGGPPPPSPPPPPPPPVARTPAGSSCGAQFYAIASSPP